MVHGMEGEGSGGGGTGIGRGREGKGGCEDGESDVGGGWGEGDTVRAGAVGGLGDMLRHFIAVRLIQ